MNTMKPLVTEAVVDIAYRASYVYCRHSGIRTSDMRYIDTPRKDVLRAALEAVMTETLHQRDTLVREIVEELHRLAFDIQRNRGAGPVTHDRWADRVQYIERRLAEIVNPSASGGRR